MARSYLVFLILFSFFVGLLAFDITGRIQANGIVDVEGLQTAKVILDNGKIQGGIMDDGSFVITDVPTGTYILSVSSPDYLFDQFRVDVTDLQTTAEVRPYVVGTPLDPPSTILLSHPILITQRQKHVYFVPPESFNLVAMFSNPMMLLMVFGGVMMLAMPYLMNHIDHETTNESKEQHAQVTRIRNAVTHGNIKTNALALMGSENSADSGSQPPKSSPLAKSRGNNKNRKK